ncbi:hypothetical protein B046DRAFT_04159 [Streptomyces sp. LamerLS-316]|uniref:hypothetical protein n=1 Tax=unclassified Streptomyces TaxID=2593676 RepID=UPI000823DB34|nr:MULTISPECIES: hypothetical protein [unclassified Streptomyces]MYQ39385.1 hypothetical protein [Streptomyces sp. SID4921]SCK42703.1 hypothetical protein B046DRAFT_04159 [Streptomyces sp. LamerLS-316]
MEIMKSGVYRIVSWPGELVPEARVLTAGEDGVTVTAPGAAPERDQQFNVEVREDGLAAIQTPARLFPSRSLSYKEAEKGGRVILGPLSDFPTREWRIEPAPQKPYPAPFFIRVTDSDLMLAVSPKLIFPPELELAPYNFDLQNAWAFLPVTEDD